jgi:hypothetical protein
MTTTTASSPAAIAGDWRPPPLEYMSSGTGARLHMPSADTYAGSVRK